MLKNRFFALCYRIFCFIFALTGILHHMGIFDGNLKISPFMYYTIQSNFLGLILFAILTVKTIIGIRSDGKLGSASYVPRFEMIVVVDLLLTLVVYWALLAPSSFAMGPDSGLWTFSNLSVHLVTPLMCFVDYILFNEAGHLKYRDVYSVLVYPIAYVLFSFIAGGLGYVYRYSDITGDPVRAPYYFIDFAAVGALVFVYIFGLVVFFLIISHIFYFVDQKVRKDKRLA